MKFYSNETKFCYDDAINSEIPESAIEITDSVFFEILRLRSENANFTVNQDGEIVDVEIPDITDEIERQKLLKEASAYLYTTDWYVIRQVETGIQVPEIVAQKRAECREILSNERDIG